MAVHGVHIPLVEVVLGEIVMLTLVTLEHPENLGLATEAAVENPTAQAVGMVVCLAVEAVVVED